MREYARQTGTGKVVSGEVGIYIHLHPDRIRAADVAFITDERFAQIRSSCYLDVAPDVVVEVLSPEYTWTQMMDKLRDYFSIGLRSVWVADPNRARSLSIMPSPRGASSVRMRPW
ncbi:MAG: Uma2 family endonuclease [Ardenticatenia bacterium]|nr:Uma2 family endonuclease [Ardenticatenia bacterium]